MNTIIFDFDGTILDTETAEFFAWGQIYKNFSCSLEKSSWEQRVGLLGESAFSPLSHLLSLIGYEVDIELIHKERRGILWEYIIDLTPRPGVIELLEEAKRRNILVAVASSSPRKWVVDHLTRLKLDKYFCSVKCGDDVNMLKPHPELYLSVLEDLHGSPEYCIAIEDSPPGVIAAKTAGISCIAVPCTLSQFLDFSFADLLLNSLAEFSIDDATRLSLWKPFPKCKCI